MTTTNDSPRRTMTARTVRLATILMLLRLLGVGGVSADEVSAPPRFDKIEVPTIAARQQTVVAGFFSGGSTAELAVVSRGEDGSLSVRFREVNGEPRMKPDPHILQSEVLWVDVANIGGKDRLLTYAPGTLRWLDPASGSEREILPLASDFEPSDHAAVLHLDATRDLNNDGLDDLLIPDGHAFWISTQQAGGAFTEPLRIGPTSGISSVDVEAGYRYDPWASSRVHLLDYDLDGRDDLVFWNEDHFQVHRQNLRGEFQETVETFTTLIPFDSDQLASLAAPMEVRNRRMDSGLNRELNGRVLHSLADINGDGVGDLVVFSLHGKSLWSLRSSHEIHFGRRGKQGLVEFAAEAGAVLDSDGIPFAITRHDFDDDRQLDIMVTVIDPGVFRALGMLVDSLLTGSLLLDLEFHQMREGTYPSRPKTTRKVRSLDLGDSGERALNMPAVLLGDVNGDRHSDLLVQKGDSKLRVFLAAPEADLFSRRPHVVEVAMPADERHVWVADLNRDGRQDILLHHPSGDRPRVTVLVAR